MVPKKNEVGARGPMLGTRLYGYSGHVRNYEQAESICSGYCGLFLKVDRGLPAPQKNGGICG